MARLKQITIIGGSDEGVAACRLAEEIGAALAREGYVVVTGGRGGIMEAANKGASKAGGISIGLLPSDSFSDANDYCSIVLPTGIGHARNALTALAGDAIVSIGGGAGTLSEICFGWIFQKPIFVFDQFGGWSEKLSDQKVDERFQTKVHTCDSVEDLLRQLKRHFTT